VKEVLETEVRLVDVSFVSLQPKKQPSKRKKRAMITVLLRVVFIGYPWFDIVDV
jgi:hypothetical protein